MLIKPVSSERDRTQYFCSNSLSEGYRLKSSAADECSDVVVANLVKIFRIVVSARHFACGLGFWTDTHMLPRHVYSINMLSASRQLF